MSYYFRTQITEGTRFVLKVALEESLNWIGWMRLNLNGGREEEVEAEMERTDTHITKYEIGAMHPF